MAGIRIALCNEVLAGMDFAAQCAFAAELGYDGLEVAPFTLSPQPHRLPPAARAEFRRAASDAGLAVTGLHWLLVTPAGLSITSPDAAVRRQTIDVMHRLIELCADLGGRTLVHGSPAQRRVAPAEAPPTARQRARDCFAAVADAAAAAGVTYCIEPLSPRETDIVTTVADAVAMVREIDHPAVRTMLDCSAAGSGEAEPAAAVLDQWLPSGLIAHVQVNDTNRRGPGQGADRFAPVLAALLGHGYARDVAVEPFDYHPDGAAAAARAIGYLRGILEALQWRAR